MRAIVKEKAGRGMSLREVPLPEYGPNDVLVRVHKAGICGTDGHIYGWDHWAQRRVHPPLDRRHEFMGNVAAVGGAVRGRASAIASRPKATSSCGVCLLCRTGQGAHLRARQIIGVDSDGAFADYIACRRSNVWKLDPAIPDELGAVFDPLGNAVHTVMAAGVSAKSVVITGVGSIGLMAIPGRARRGRGAGLRGRRQSREARARRARRRRRDVFDATRPDLVDEISRRTGGDGVDVLLEMSGSGFGDRQRACRWCATAARAALLGIPPDDVKINLAERIIFKGLTVLGINGRKMFETWYQTQALVKSGRVDLRRSSRTSCRSSSSTARFELDAQRQSREDRSSTRRARRR